MWTERAERLLLLVLVFPLCVAGLGLMAALMTVWRIEEGLKQIEAKHRRQQDLLAELHAAAYREWRERSESRE